MRRLVNYLFFLSLIALLQIISCISNKRNPIDFVDPFICTEGDNGQLYPGASYPFGLVQLSPETEGDSHVGYYYEDKYIEGFSHLRILGAGSKGKGGGLLIKPGIGKFTNKINEFREKYIKESEQASPGYYKVILVIGVKAELTVPERVSFHRYTFPEDKKEDRYVVVELSHSYVGMLDASLNVKNNHKITGMIKSLHNNSGDYHKLFFAIVSDTPFESYNSWKGEEKGNLPVLEGNSIGVRLNFPKNSNNIVQLKVSLSPVGEDMAMMEAITEIKGWNFNKVRINAASTWNKKLSKIEIKGGLKEGSID